MSLTIYGIPASRAFRVLWAAEETGLPYANDPLSYKDPAIKAPPYLAINPNGTIPAIVDDGLRDLLAALEGGEVADLPAVAAARERHRPHRRVVLLTLGNHLGRPIGDRDRLGRGQREAGRAAVRLLDPDQLGERFGAERRLARRVLVRETRRGGGEAGQQRDQDRDRQESARDHPGKASAGADGTKPAPPPAASGQPR